MRELMQGDIRELASDPEGLRDHLLIRVDLFEDHEIGTVIGVSENPDELRERRATDLASGNPGGEYFLFHPLNDDGVRFSEGIINPNAHQGWKGRQNT